MQVRSTRWRRQQRALQLHSLSEVQRSRSTARDDANSRCGRRKILEFLLPPPGPGLGPNKAVGYTFSSVWQVKSAKHLHKCTCCCDITVGIQNKELCPINSAGQSSHLQRTCCLTYRNMQSK